MSRSPKQPGVLDEARLQRMRARVAAMSALAVAVGAAGCERTPPPAINTPVQHTINEPATPPPTVNNPPMLVAAPDAAAPTAAPDAAAPNVLAVPPDADVLPRPMPINRPPPRRPLAPPSNG